MDRSTMSPNSGDGSPGPVIRRPRKKKQQLGPIEKRSLNGLTGGLTTMSLATSTRSQAVVSGWCESYVDEAASFTSLTLWAEQRLAESTVSPAGMPSKERTVALFEVCHRVTSVFRRFAPLMRLVIREMLLSVYVGGLSSPSSPEDLLTGVTWFERAEQLTKEKRGLARALAERPDLVEEDDADELAREDLVVLGRHLRAWARLVMTTRGSRRVCERLQKMRTRLAKRAVLGAMHVALLRSRTFALREAQTRLAAKHLEFAQLRSVHTALREKELATTIIAECAPTPPPVIVEEVPVVLTEEQETQTDKEEEPLLLLAAEVEEVEPPGAVVVRKKRKTKPPWGNGEPEDAPVAASKSLIAQIYDVVIALERRRLDCPAQTIPFNGMTLVDLTRDFCIRKYGVRSLAAKIESSLLRLMRYTEDRFELVRRGHDLRPLSEKFVRIHVFANIYADYARKVSRKKKQKGAAAGGTKSTVRRSNITFGKNALLSDANSAHIKYNQRIFRIFSALLLAIQDLMTTKLSLAMSGANNGMLEKTVVTRATAKVFMKLQTLDVSAWKQLLAELDALPTVVRATKDRQTTCVSVDLAMQVALRWMPHLLTCERIGGDTPLFSVVLRIQRMAREHIERNKQRRVWAHLFEAFDVLLQHDGCFTFAEFYGLVIATHGARLKDELAMAVFNDWHDFSDEMVDRELEETKITLKMRIALMTFQRFWRARRRFQVSAIQIEETASRRSVAEKQHEKNAQEFKDEWKKSRANHAILLALTTPLDRQNAIKYETMLGGKAKEAFGWVMVDYGFRKKDADAILTRENPSELLKYLGFADVHAAINTVKKPHSQAGSFASLKEEDEDDIIFEMNIDDSRVEEGNEGEDEEEEETDEDGG